MLELLVVNIFYESILVSVCMCCRYFLLKTITLALWADGVLESECDWLIPFQCKSVFIYDPSALFK